MDDIDALRHPDDGMALGGDRKVWMARKLSDHTTEVYEIMNKYYGL